MSAAGDRIPGLTMLDGLGRERPLQGFSGGVVFLVSSVLVTVPSDDWVTVFSLVFTVPSLLTVLVLSLETWRSHPTSRNDNAKPDMATQLTITCFFMATRYGMGRLLSMG